MLNLALDTATFCGRFALAEDDRLLSYRPVNVGGSYADALLPVVASMLRDAGRQVTELAALAITHGPGSFTGVRIGVATAKGLAYGLGARLYAVSTLEAMAAALLAEQMDCLFAVPVLDARRGEIFAAVYGRCDQWVEPLAAPASLAPDAWWQRVRQALPELAETVFGGDGVALLVGQAGRLRPELRQRGQPVRRPWSAAHPATARAMVLAMADSAAPLKPVHPFGLTPLYLRASDAEIKQRVDLTPSEPGRQITSHRPSPPAETS